MEHLLSLNHVRVQSHDNFTDCYQYNISYYLRYWQNIVFTLLTELTELGSNISISVFCGIVKVTFIKLCYHGEHKESII